jgi:hypothetical protein
LRVATAHGVGRERLLSRRRRARTPIGFLILARDFHLQQDEIDRKKRDPAELRPEELRIREKFGLLEDTPVRDVTRRGSPLL